jgi:hypothetical protein
MKLLAISEVAALVKSGKPLLLAGDEQALAQLPRGNWIGGTIPYFMTADGGCQNREHVFVHELPEAVARCHVRTYDTGNISKVFAHGFDNGLSAIIVPAFSPIHQAFANGAPHFPDFAAVPLFGWVAGVHLSTLGQATPKVFEGTTGQVHTDVAVVMHLQLSTGYYANVDIINLFQPGPGDELSFPEGGFAVDRVLVNGRECSFYGYLTEHKIDLRLPLVADYCGAHINVSFQGLDDVKRSVNLYAPVFENVVYRLAAPVADYVAEFEKRLDGAGRKPMFSCNCILNYLYAELEGKRTGPFTGPVTFGEIAFQLLNQTLVYVDVGRVSP